MKLIIDKSKCTIKETLNGRALEIETFDPVYIEEYDHKHLLTTSEYTDGLILTPAPDNYLI